MYNDNLQELISNWSNMDLDELVMRTNKNIDINLIKKILKSKKINTESLTYLKLLTHLLKIIFDETDLEYDLISDDLYDEIVVCLSNHNIQVTGSSNKRLELSMEHEYPDLKGSTDKAKYVYDKDIPNNEYNTKSVEEFINKVLKKLNIPLSKKLEIAVSLKYDGTSVITTELDNIIALAISRGKDGVGTDLTNIVRSLRKNEFKGKIGVKNELLLKKDHLDIYNDLTNGNNKNTRSAINSILNNPQYAYLLDLVPLEFDDGIHTRKERLKLINSSFDNEICFYYKIFKDTPEELLKIINGFYILVERNRTELPFGIDGIVIEFLDEDIRESLGRSGDINNYEIALKFPSETRITTVLGVTQEIGKFGKETPKLIFDEITFSNGSIHHQCSLSNYNKFMGMDIHKHDEIEIKYVNQVLCQAYAIPQEHTGERIILSDICPVCYKKLIFTGTGKERACINMYCPKISTGILTNFVSRIGIRDIKENTINMLKANGIDSIEKIIEIDKYSQRLLNVKGIGEGTLRKIILGIRNAKNGIEDYKVLNSLSFPNIGKELWKNIFKKITIYDLIDMYEHDYLNKLSFIENISYKRIDVIKDTLKERIDILSYIVNNFNVKSYIDNNINIEVRCTGVRIPKEQRIILESKGMTIRDGSPTKNTNYFVRKDSNYMNAKVEKAIKLRESGYDIDIFTLDEFLDKMKTLQYL